MTKQERLSQLYHKTQRKREAVQEMAQIQEKHAELTFLVTQYRQKLACERADVDRLDKASLPNLFYRVTGKKEDKRDKEMAEAVEAQARYDAASEELKAVTDEMGYLKYELRTLGNCDLDHDALQKEMVAALVSSHAEAAPEAERLLRQMNQARQEENELTELIRTGEDARSTATELYEVFLKIQRVTHHPRTSVSGSIIAGAVITHITIDDLIQSCKGTFDQLKRQIARFHTPLCPLPRFACLRAAEDLLAGRTWGGTAPIDHAVNEIETLLQDLLNAHAKLEDLKQKRLERQDRFHRTLTELLLAVPPSQFEE